MNRLGEYQLRRKISQLIIRKETTEANAQLIAAAPDLLDACEAAYSYLKTEGKERSLLGQQLFETLKKAKS